MTEQRNSSIPDNTIKAPPMIVTDHDFEPYPQNVQFPSDGCFHCGKIPELHQNIIDLPKQHRDIAVILPSPITITQLAKVSHEIALHHGWYEGHEVPELHFLTEKLVLWHSEISEAVEELRMIKDMDELSAPPQISESGKPENFLVEVADLLIRVFDSVQHLGLIAELEDCIRMKTAYNITRPYRHGGKSL